jgi:2-oxo-4-hydroxy-4-carboxy--5-ureidoimidazoline (OHCU) decarboxylase
VPDATSPALPPLDTLNAMSPEQFSAAIAFAFEGAPGFLRRLADARPFASEEQLLARAREIAREMPEAEQIELLDAHPQIGADPAAVSALSYAEQGYEAAEEEPGEDAPHPDAWVADELAALNDAYESRFGFRFVVFVAGRPRRDIIPILERALGADRDEELRRGVDDVIHVAADRMAKLRAHGIADMEEAREAVVLELSRWIAGEVQRDELIVTAARLVDEGVDYPGLIELARSETRDDAALFPIVRGLLAELGLQEWDANDAAQLVALNAATELVEGRVDPYRGTQRMVRVGREVDPGMTALPWLRPLVELLDAWEEAPDRRAAVEREMVDAARRLLDDAA